MNTTPIPWTDLSWNFASGCTPVSRGCANCYAMRQARRLRGRCGYPGDDPFRVVLHPERLHEPMRKRRASRIFACSMGDLFHEDIPDEYLDQAFAVMACSTYSLSGQAHTFQILTKRPERMLEYIGHPKREQRINDALADLIEQHSTRADRWRKPQLAEAWLPVLRRWPLPNVWPGVSIEDQEHADERIPYLLKTPIGPGAVRWVSCEPLLGPLDLEPYLIEPSERICANCWQFKSAKYEQRRGICRVHRALKPYPNTPACTQFEDMHASDFESAREWRGRIEWVVVGGETGPRARPCHPDWVRSLRDQAKGQGVPFFFKQWGEWAPRELFPEGLDVTHSLSRIGCFDRDSGEFTRGAMSVSAQHMVYVGRKRAGRLLDAREWGEYPQARR